MRFFKNLEVHLVAFGIMLIQASSTSGWPAVVEIDLWLKKNSKFICELTKQARERVSEK